MNEQLEDRTEAQEEQEARQAMVLLGDDAAIGQFASAREEWSLAKTFQTTLPGADKLKPNDLRLVARFTLATGLNPYGKHFYVYRDNSGLHLELHYALLGMWAREFREDFTERTVPLTQAEMPAGAIGYRCHLVKDSRLKLLDALIKAYGQDIAREMVETQAIGIVPASDRTNRDNKPIPPPHGWTWDQVAKKRAFRSALRLAFGDPTIEELRKLSFKAGDIDTKSEDWDPEIADPAEQSAVAALNAEYRVITENRDPEATAAEAVGELYGDEAGAEYAQHAEARRAALPLCPEMPACNARADVYKAAAQLLGFQTTGAVSKAAKSIDPDGTLSFEGLWSQLWEYQQARE